MAKLQSLSIQGVDIRDYVLNIIHEPRNILFIGDSYAAESASYTENTGSTVGWPENCKHNVYNLGSSYIVAQGGAGFGKTGIYSASYLLSNWLSSSEGKSNKNSITDVVFGFGYNDCYDLAYGSSSDYGADVTNGILKCAQLLESNMPHAKPWLFSVGWGSNPYVRAKADTMYNSLYPACTIVKWTYCQAHPIMYNPYFFAGDRVHPNNEGSLRLGQYIANCLNYGNTNMIRPTQAIRTTDTNVLFGFANTVSPNSATLTVEPNVVFNQNSDYTLSDGDLCRLCNIDYFTLGSINLNTSQYPNTTFTQPVVYHIAGSQMDKYVTLGTGLVSVSAGTKYGHEIFDTVVTVRNRTGQSLSFSKVAPESGKLNILSYYG